VPLRVHGLVACNRQYGRISPHIVNKVNKNGKRKRRLYPIRRRTKPGAPPGTITVDPHAHETEIDLFAYGPDGFIEEKLIGPDRVRQVVGKWPVTWVNVDGLGDVKALREIADMFKVHPLALEDVVNVHQRAKVEEYGDQLFVVARMTTLDKDGELETEQLSIVLGPGFVVTFQERPGDVLDPVRDRIRGGRQICRENEDFLAYALIDAVVDHYFPVLESLGERLEDLEEEVVTCPDKIALAKIHKVKRDLLLLRRAIWPEREALSRLHRDVLPQIGDTARIYLRDSYDHTVQVIDLLESYREMAASLLDVYLSQTSNRLNEVMKVLTIFASIFIPLTFITSLYGMNFDTNVSPLNMPELEWAWGYPYALALMLAVTLATLGYFQHKGWLTNAPRRARQAKEERERLQIRSSAQTE